jgi:dihydrofolate reductase
MKKLMVKTAISLDGFLEGPNGDMDWFPKDDQADWDENFALTDQVDAVLLGRVTYRGYSAFWRSVLAAPSEHSANEVAFARWADKTRHIVFSRSLNEVDWSNSEIRRDLAEDVPALKREAGKNLLVYGGSSFIGALTERGLVDEYHLVVHPVVLGGGKPLFKAASERRVLERTRVKQLPSGAVWLSYRS